MKKKRAVLIAAGILLCLLGAWCDAGCARDGTGGARASATKAPAAAPASGP
jgi:hypothetical protein